MRLQPWLKHLPPSAAARPGCWMLLRSGPWLWGSRGAWTCRWVPLKHSMGGSLGPPFSLLWNKCRFAKRENGSWLVGAPGRAGGWLAWQIERQPGCLLGTCLVARACSSALPFHCMLGSNLLAPQLQGVSSLAWAYSTLQYDHPQLYEVLASAAVTMLRTPPSRAARSGSGSSSSSRRVGRSAAPGCTRADFSAQAVSVLAFSFASANRCDSPVQRQVSTAVGWKGAHASGVEFCPRGCRCRHGAAQRRRLPHMPSTSCFETFPCGACIQVFTLVSNCPADQMYELLAERAGEVLEQLTPQGLANLAWGLTVAACYPPQVGRVATAVFELTRSAVRLLSVAHGVLSALAAGTAAVCHPPR